jgi:hypothetical protein
MYVDTKGNTMRCYTFCGTCMHFSRMHTQWCMFRCQLLSIMLSSPWWNSGTSLPSNVENICLWNIPLHVAACIVIHVSPLVSPGMGPLT